MATTTGLRLKRQITIRKKNINSLGLNKVKAVSAIALTWFIIYIFIEIYSS
jgi:hypothetical protein